MYGNFPMTVRNLLVTAGIVGAAVVAPSASHAADPWSGPYAGLFAGYAWGRAEATEATDPALLFPFYNGVATPYRFDPDGAFAGAAAGYNWQSGAVVAGVEGEIGYLGLRGSVIDPNGIAIFGTPDTETSLRSDFYAALSARLGIAAGPALLYVKGGGALLRARASTIDPCVAPPAGCGTGTLTMNGSETMLGWSIGGGAEWAFAPRWTVKAEYVFFDFGNIDTAGTSNVPGEFYRQSIDVTAHTVRLGVNYRFGASAPLAVRR
jgi:outer membrane immunogenic protein